MMAKSRAWMAGLGLGLVIQLVGVAPAADPTPGETLYRKYCGACHGPTGKGDGLAGTFMTPKPTDLTTLAAGNDGVFPFNDVLQFVDGTNTVRAHGEPEMPVWGERFRLDAADPAAKRAEARGKVMQIVEYLKSIQVP